VQIWRSLCTNVDGKAWCATGTGLRRAMYRRSFVMRCAGSTGSAVGVSSSPGILRGSTYTSSATDACTPALNYVWMPRGARGSASVDGWSAWHMMAAISVRCKRSTSPLDVGWWAVVEES
jgi:hypothetical protein